MARAKSAAASARSSATIGFAARLWLAADKLRSHMDAAASHIPATLRGTLLPQLPSGKLSVAQG